MFENKKQHLLSKKAFAHRVRRFSFIALGIVVASLLLGILGYRYFESMSWIDATVNASMILGGMGPVDTLHTVSGKLFASFYALFSGVIFLISIGIFIAPVIHRFMHTFHLEPEED